jgi:hypothetical protein
LVAPNITSVPEILNWTLVQLFIAGNTKGCITTANALGEPGVPALAHLQPPENKGAELI